MSEEKLELFTIESSQFDENTYWGRFEAFRAVVNPRHTFYSNSRIRGMQALIAAQKADEQAQFERTGERKVLRSK
jgi:hypothetical protein